MSISPTNPFKIKLNFSDGLPEEKKEAQKKIPKQFKKHIYSTASPSHFHLYTLKKIKKMKSIVMTRKIAIFKRLYKKNITHSYEMAIDYEIYDGFNAFCSSLNSNVSLTKLNLSNMMLDHLLWVRLIKSLENHCSLRQLDISNNTISCLGYKYIFKALKNNKKLESFNLFNNRIENENFRDLNTMLQFCKLKEINFNFTEIDSEGLKLFFDGLVHNTSIRVVKIANKNLNYSALVGLSLFLSKSPKPKLEELDLSYCNLSSKEIQIMMKNMPSMRCCRGKRSFFPHIHSLVLAGNKINGKICIENFNEMISQIKNIYSLDLTKNLITSYDLVLLAPSFRKVEVSLNLSYNRFNENFPENIDFLYHLTNLNLSSNNLQYESIEIIAKTIEDSPSWISLDLSHNQIDDKSMDILIKSLRKNATLSILDLSYNKISDNGLQDFENSLQFIKLRKLVLSNNPIGTLGLNFLFPNSLKTSVCLKEILLENIEFYDESMSNSNDSRLNSELNLKNIEKLSVENSVFISDFVLKNLICATSLVELNLNDSYLEENIINLSNFLITQKNLMTLKLKNVGLSRLKPQEISHLWKGLEMCIPLESLDISKNNIGKYLKDFIACAKKMERIKTINISSNILENEHAFLISELIAEKDLTEIDLSGNLFSYMAFESISQALLDNTSLKTLKIGKMQLDLLCLIPLGNVINKNATLENLDLSNTVFNSNSILQLNSKERGNLTEMRFNYMKFESFQYAILLNMLHYNPKIRVLDLEACVFRRLKLSRLIKYSCNLINLVNLNLSGISFTDVEICQLFMRLKGHKHLESLILQNVELGVKSLFGLGKFLQNNKSLKTLDLSSNCFTKIFFEQLKSSLNGSSKLFELKFNDCQIKDENFIVILEILEKCASLQRIELNNNNLSFDSLVKLFSKEIRGGKQLIQKLVFTNNLFKCEEQLIPKNLAIKALYFNSIMELNLMNTLHLLPHEMIKTLLQFMTRNKNLTSLNLNRNNLSDDLIKIISDSLAEDCSLLFLSLASNRFSLVGLDIFFQKLKKNSQLIFLDISNNIKNQEEAQIFANYLKDAIIDNKKLEIVDISKNFLGNHVNHLLKSVFLHNKNFLFLNETWNSIHSSKAVKIIESMQSFYNKYTRDHPLYSRINETIFENKRFSILDFSKAELDDDFCLFFSDNLHKMPFLKEFIFTENYNITLSGLKSIYVGMVLHKDNSNLDKVYFEKINTKVFLNNGIAASIAEWGKYGEETSKCRKLLQNFSYHFFSKLITVNNKFQFGDNFSEFSKKFRKSCILLFYFLNFIISLTLSIALPVGSIISCERGHTYNSHIIYSVYVGIMTFIEFFFWIYYKRKMTDYSENEKSLKREVFISDILFLVGSVGEKYNLYLDMCFITISRSCDEVGVSNAFIVIVAIKFTIYVIMALKAMMKLFTAIRRENEVAILNLITKIALIESFFLIGDILDRYVPGNVKRFQRILGFKLKRAIFISTNILLAILKFFLEDIPQSIIQCYYIFDLQEKRDKADEWIILINIAKNFISLIVSFYTAVSVRPSYIEQADFDERLNITKINSRTQKLDVISVRRGTTLLSKHFEKENIEQKLSNLRISLHQGQMTKNYESVPLDNYGFQEFFQMANKHMQGY